MLMAEQINPTSTKILVRPYEKPDRFGEHIILPDPYRQDMSGTLWEFIKGGPKYAEVLGVELEEGDIIQTRRPMSGIHLTDDLWMITAEMVQVVHAWVSTGDEDDED